MKKLIFILLLSSFCIHAKSDDTTFLINEAIKVYASKYEIPEDFSTKVIHLDNIIVVNFIEPADFYFNKYVGFVVLGYIGKDVIPLAYSDHYKLNVKNTCINLLLNSYQKQIEKMIAEGISLKECSDNEITHRKVQPLLGEMFWSQHGPYNNKLPVADNGKHCVTGCVSLAMAQIMNYYDYPSKGIGQDSCTITYNGKTETHFVDFQEMTIRWDKIKNKYIPFHRTEESDEVANLLYYCTISIEPTLSQQKGAAELKKACTSLVKHFGYHHSAQLCDKANYSDDKWIELIRKELDAGRPVISGAMKHVFVCDGYDNDFWHINWGWEGMMNGYFRCSLLPSEQANVILPQYTILNLFPSVNQIEK